MQRQPKPKNQAILDGFNSTGELVFQKVLDLSDYWEELHPVIDSAQFRREQGIRRLVGNLFGQKGNLIQQFECMYSEEGLIQTHYARHEDGTEIGNPP